MSDIVIISIPIKNLLTEINESGRTHLMCKVGATNTLTLNTSIKHVLDLLNNRWDFLNFII